MVSTSPLADSIFHSASEPSSHLISRSSFCDEPDRGKYVLQYQRHNSMEGFHTMRKTLGITLTTAALMFGGAGVANATATTNPMPSSTTSTLADNYGTTDGNDHSDKTGLWGLVGLLGLAGLVGLKRRNDSPAARNPGAAGAPGAPGAPGYGTTPPRA